MALLGELLALDLDIVVDRGHAVDLLTEVGRLKRVVECLESSVQAHVLRLGAGVPETVTAAEVALATRVPKATASRMLHEADELAGALLPLREALGAGRLSMQHVRRCATVLRPLLLETPELATELAAAILPYAERHTAGETESRLKTWVIRADPIAADARHENALAMCTVTLDALDDGLGLLSITGPIEQTTRAFYAISATARADAAADGEERPIGQRRSELALGVLLDAATPCEGLPEELLVAPETAVTLLEPREVPSYLPGWSREESRSVYCGPRWREELYEWRELYDDPDPSDLTAPEPPDTWCDGGPPPPRRGQPVTGKLCRTGTAPYLGVISFDLPTFLGLADNPMLLDGSIPISPWHGRQLIQLSDLTALLLDETDGSMLSASPHVYRPSRATAAYVRLRDPVCGEPGCTVPAHRCELDHERSFDHADPSAGGQTVVQELGPLCKDSHQRKTHHGFRIERDADGQRWWVTPQGRSYLMERFDHRPDRGYPG